MSLMADNTTYWYILLAGGGRILQLVITAAVGFTVSNVKLALSSTKNAPMT